MKRFKVNFLTWRKLYFYAPGADSVKQQDVRGFRRAERREFDEQKKKKRMKAFKRIAGERNTREKNV